ncbi:hypothetical protein ACFW1A_05100 [Kitasatospora sp. NPDC058965]|uniref:hypothetical protein n=1 Tax=Kitasatospora sp. NPDC058965 TaxID=3346682 RepID=UPI0036752571
MTTPGGHPAFGPGHLPAGPWLRPGWAVAPPAPKPGTVPLRALDAADVIGGVFGTVRRYPAALYYPLLLVGLAGAGVFGGCLAVARDAVAPLPASGRLTHQQVADLVTAGAALLVVLALLAVLDYAVAAAVSCVVLRHAVLGRPLTARRAWAEARPWVWRVLGVQLLVGAAALGILLASALPSVVLFLLNGGGAAGWALLLLLPGTAGALHVGVRLLLAVPVLVLEEQRPVAAVRRAWRLNEGAWWRTLGISYAVTLIGDAVARSVTTTLAAGVLQLLPQDALDGGSDVSASWLSGSGVLVLAVGCAAVLALLSVARAPLAPLTSGLLYLDRRFRRENLAPTLAAAAGTAAAPPPAPGRAW